MLLMSDINDVQYLCPDNISDFMYCKSHPIKFFLIKLLNAIDRPVIVTPRNLCPTPLSD